MTSLNRNKILDRRLFILSTGLLLQAHSAFAGDSIGDAQAQARGVVEAPIVNHVASVDGFTATQASGRVASRQDPQEQARDLLLGKPEEGSVTRSAIAADAADAAEDGARSTSAQDRRAYIDPQESARRVILGSGAPASSTSHNPIVKKPT
jgi:hypothetical protein